MAIGPHKSIFTGSTTVQVNKRRKGELAQVLYTMWGF
jgi:hypothetical protein